MFTEGNDVECTARFSYAAELTAIYIEVGNRALEKVFREKSHYFLIFIININIFFIFFRQLTCGYSGHPLASAILKVRASQISVLDDVSIADDRRVAREVKKG